ncbi:hypothetical protein SHAb15599_00072 [Acinetobacter phage SH-Ab 15599]|nr:hypothetical protein SHAb15599_00072 [Acinetobacter phage SH-Ab 15599]
MEVSISALKTLIFKLNRFVNGGVKDTVELEDGRKIRTMAGIDASIQQRNFIQVVKDYSDINQALTDAQQGSFLKEGHVIKVHNSLDKRLNGFYEVTATANLRKMDGYELFDFFPVTTDIQRTSINQVHTAYELNIDKPLIGQTVHGSFMITGHLRGKQDLYGMYHAFCGLGIDSTGNPYIDIKELVKDDLSLTHSFQDMGDYYNIKINLETLIDLNDIVAISSIINSQMNLTSSY